jgi:hypothetical protein
MVGSPQLVLSVGFVAMASPTAEVNGMLPPYFLVNSNSKIGFRSIRFVGEATALFHPSTPTKGSFIYRKTGKG